MPEPSTPVPDSKSSNIMGTERIRFAVLSNMWVDLPGVTIG